MEKHGKNKTCKKNEDRSPNSKRKIQKDLRKTVRNIPEVKRLKVWKKTHFKGFLPLDLLHSDNKLKLLHLIST